ncbi:MAG TPA: ABC transporter permease [Candidatus Angelobacter sp.]
MRAILQDLRFGFRNLKKTRGLTVVAIITLALGIGANTAIFSVIDAVLLRPLPFQDSGQLVRLWETESAPGHYPFAGPDFVDWKTQSHSFEDMTLYAWAPAYNLGDQGRAEHVIGTPTESNFFSLLGARPLLGRTWAPDEDEPGHDHVVILSFGLWKTHFAADPHVIDRQIELNNEKYTVVGVMPASFHYPLDAQIWVPQDMDTKSLYPRGNHWANVLGRLKPGISVQQAQAELSLIAKRLEQQYPDSNHNVGAFILPMQEAMVGQSRTSLMMMLWAVGLVLLIACANVANLLLSRSVVRQKEMAVRIALGAPRGRLVRQLLTESLLLAVAGAVAGLIVAAIALRVTTLELFSIPHLNSIEINLPVLGFTLLSASVAGILFGIFPAWQTSRPDLHDELRGGAGSSSVSRHRRFTSNALVVTEVALSVLLLIASGLLLKDFIRLRTNSIGVRTENVWTAAISLPKSKYADPRKQNDFSQTLLQAVRNIPGVESAAITDHLPLEGGNNSSVKLRGHPSTQWEKLLVENHGVTPGYFHALGIPLLQGRDFTDQDVQTSLDLDIQIEELFKNGKPDAQQLDKMVYPAVINEQMARIFWPNQNPLGQMYSPGGEPPWRQVIGVVGDVKQWDLVRGAQPEGYTAFDGDSRNFLVVHTSAPLAGFADAVRHELKQIDSTLPLFSVRSMSAVIAESAAGEEFITLLIGIFASVALLLASVGIYGVLSYAVTQRTQEIGIRMSLGATQAHVLRLVLAQGGRLILCGFVLGVAGAFAVQRLLASSLHAVKANDPAIYVAAPLCLVLIALLACYIPARRATRVDPLLALRHE